MAPTLFLQPQVGTYFLAEVVLFFQSSELFDHSIAQLLVFENLVLVVIGNHFYKLPKPLLDRIVLSHLLGVNYLDLALSLLLRRRHRASLVTLIYTLENLLKVSCHRATTYMIFHIYL